MRPLPLAFRQVHLDFHTSEQIRGIGSRFDPEAFARTLLDARVDSVTCFSKCHHGMIYHDTRFPARHPHLELNLLREQIQACHAAGIRVPIYISVGFDEYMAREHPEWLEITAEGKVRGAAPLQPGWRNLCFNTAYVDYVSEQTREVLESFPTDGLFFDIIHQGPCCCAACMRGMAEEGLDPADEAGRRRYAREVTERMKRRLTAEIRALNPHCLLFWNSGHVDPTFRRSLDTFTHLELESLPSGGWGYDHFPLTVRYARNLGLDYLGMTGKFHKTWAGFGEYKNREALEYEAFTALAEGAKVSIGDQLPPDGRLNAATYALIGGVYASVAEKEPWCADATAVAEIAVFNPEALGVHDGRVDTAAGGAYHMLIEAHHQFDLVDAEMDWSRYAVLVLPDKIRLSDSLRARVRAFLHGGGRLIASHQSGLAEERDEFVLPELGVRYVGEAEFSPDYVVPSDAVGAGMARAEQVMYERALYVQPDPRAERLAEIWQPYFDRTYAHFCSHRHSPVERASGYPAMVATEKTVYFAHPIFGSFMRHGVRPYKQLFLNALQRLLPDPMVRSDAPSTAHISVTRQETPRGERTVVHVLHYIPEQRYRDIQTVEAVLPLYNVDLSIRLEREPRAVYLAPERIDLPVSWTGDRAEITIPSVLGHAVVVFE